MALYQKDLIILRIYFFIFFKSQFFNFSYSSESDSIHNLLSKIDIEKSNYFSKILVEDNDGRIKPFQSLSSEMLRKISRKQSFSYEHNGQDYKINSNQVLLGMILYPSEWMKMDLITIGKNEKVKNIFPLNKEYLSYWDFGNQV